MLGVNTSSWIITLYAKRVAQGLLVTHHVPSEHQLADLFTKPLPKAALQYFCSKLCLQPRQSLREGVNAASQSTQLRNSTDSMQTVTAPYKATNHQSMQQVNQRQQQSHCGEELEDNHLSIKRKISTNPPLPSPLFLS